jgi:hypothetical protein
MGSPGPSAAPAPGRVARRAAGRVVAGRSSGGPPAGRASAAGSWVIRAAAVADRPAGAAQPAEQSTVDLVQPWARVASAQHGDLVAKHQDLDVLGCVGAHEQCQPARHAGERQVRESEGHSRRSCSAPLWTATAMPKTVQVRAARRRARSDGCESADQGPCHGSRHPQVAQPIATARAGGRRDRGDPGPRRLGLRQPRGGARLCTR